MKLKDICFITLVGCALSFVIGFAVGESPVDDKTVTVLNPTDSNPVETVSPLIDTCKGYKGNPILDQKLKYMVKRMAVLQKEVHCIRDNQERGQVIETIRCTHKADFQSRSHEQCDHGWAYCEWENW